MKRATLIIAGAVIPLLGFAWERPGKYHDVSATEFNCNESIPVWCYKSVEPSDSSASVGDHIIIKKGTREVRARIIAIEPRTGDPNPKVQVVLDTPDEFT